MARLMICAAMGCEAVAVPGRAHCCDCAERVRRVRADRRAAAKAASPWAHLYQSAEWQRLRRRVLYPQGPKRPAARCVDCSQLGADWIEATVVDHVVPHRGDMALFLSRANLQPLCASCHGRKSQRERMMTGGEG